MIAYKALRYLCECGYQMMPSPSDKGGMVLACPRETCDHYGKIFEHPSIELVEVTD